VVAGAGRVRVRVKIVGRGSGGCRGRGGGGVEASAGRATGLESIAVKHGHTRRATDTDPIHTALTASGTT